MAVVQISRIQHRRGKKLTGSGLPQLSSGELGWAIDTQQLYVGNGSVAEGSPAVGNTELLTQHTNIFSLANSYSYKSGNATVWNTVTPTSRTLQSTLEDTVSVLDFGATGDGTTDDTVSIQNALYSFLDGSVANRKILYFPPGQYKTTAVLNIPPYAVIRGAGKEKSIIVSTSSTNVFRTVNSSTTRTTVNVSTSTSLDSAGGNQSRHIEISDISIDMSTTTATVALDLDMCANSIFKNIKLIGSWTNGTVRSGAQKDTGITMSSNGVATCKNNVFENCDFDGIYYGVYSNFDIKDNLWNFCLFEHSYNAIAFGTSGNYGSSFPGQATGPIHNDITSCRFNYIDRQAINITTGKYNTSSNNRFYNVGNDNGAPSVAVSSNIHLHKYNISKNDYFERTEALTPNKLADTYYNEEYVPEVSGPVSWSAEHSNSINIGQHNVESTITLLKFPAIDNGSVVIDYQYTSTGPNVVRHGVIEIICHIVANEIQVCHENTILGDTAHASGLTFTAAFADAGTVKSGNDTIILSVSNTQPVTTDEFKYKMKIKS